MEPGRNSFGNAGANIRGPMRRTQSPLRHKRARLSRTALAVVLAATVAGCTASVTKHGHLLSQADLQQVQPGVSKEQVQTTLGTPDTTSTVGGGAYYYISSTREQKAFMKPTVIDRRVVAVYFDEFGTVENVARYGLKDGKVFDFISRETPTHSRDLGVIQKIFRGIGTPNTPSGSTIGRRPI